MEIDKHSPLPIYYQIQQEIKRMIESGKWKEGDKIPSENELSERFGVSRMTIRQAITKLVEESMLERYRGLGTYVTKKKVEQPTKALTSYTEYMQSLGYRTSSQIVEYSVAKASERVAKELAVLPETAVHRVVRVRYANEEPCAIETAYFPFVLFPHLNEEHLKNSFYAYAEKTLGHRIHHADQSIEATVADEQEAELLDTSVGVPLLLTKQTTSMDNRQPIEYVHCVYRADLFKFKVHLLRETLTQ
ncbi:MAG: GntR family transcriptional regulator [Bacilli bacterium]